VKLQSIFGLTFRTSKMLSKLIRILPWLWRMSYRLEAQSFSLNRPFRASAKLYNALDTASEYPEDAFVTVDYGTEKERKSMFTVRKK
jgi:hypothetical protein